MKRLMAICTILAIAVAMSGCASMTVSSHIERGVNFADFVTYDWGPPDNLPVGDPRLDNNPFFNDYLQGAVEKKLAGQGLRARLAAGTPDLLVHYHASVNQRMDVYEADNRYGYCYGDCQPQVNNYDQGTLDHRHRRYEDEQGRVARLGAGHHGRRHRQPAAAREAGR